MSILIARRSGLVVVDGRRRTVRQGVTTAETGSWIVARYPHLWEPIQVDYPAPGAGEPAPLVEVQLREQVDPTPVESPPARKPRKATSRKPAEGPGDADPAA